MGEVLSVGKYKKLVSDIRKLIGEGKTRAEEAARNELVQMYWEIGRRIVSEGLSENAGYGDSVIDDLAGELDVERSTLYRCVSFFKLYKVAPRGNNLTWSHYKELMGIKDDEVRFMLEIKAQDGGWSRQQLVDAIKMQSEKKGVRGGKRLARPSDPTYLYKGVVDNVIDGDTLLFRLDLGFQVWKEQRIRLAGVDCPGIDEVGGEDAAKYVLEQMAKAEIVMVKTNKIDIYGRYVAHVFYSLSGEADKASVFAKGRYLNEELLDKGFAVTLDV